MADFEINNCHMCGSTAILDSDQVNNIYGIDWQNSYVNCTRCRMSLNLNCEYESFQEGIHESLINCWNSLKHKTPGKKFKIELSKDEIDLIMPSLIELKNNIYDKYKNDNCNNRFIAWNSNFIEKIINHIKDKVNGRL